MLVNKSLNLVVMEFLRDHAKASHSEQMHLEAGLRHAFEGRRIRIYCHNDLGRRAVDESATVTHVGFTFLHLDRCLIGMVNFHTDLRFFGDREFLRLETSGDFTSGFLAILRPRGERTESQKILDGNIVQVLVGVDWQE
jgi:hypothetical protein